jgi:hypothetical protein
MITETTSTFLDNLLADVEQKENQNIKTYHDLIAMEVIKLENEIAANFSQAEVECPIINGWALRKNAAIQDRANLHKMKLESFIRSEGKKTIEMPRAVLKIRKSPDKVEIIDMDTFLTNANAEMLRSAIGITKPALAKKLTKLYPWNLERVMDSVVKDGVSCGEDLNAVQNLTNYILENDVELQKCLKNRITEGKRDNIV